MIEAVKGNLVQCDATHVVVDLHGLYMGMDVSLRASQAIQKQGDRVHIPTHLHVKEGILELYGFASQREKEVFLKLITVSGIGPKIALRILSDVTPSDLVHFILTEQIAQLTALKGIGKKTAQVMVATLKSPLSNLDMNSPDTGASNEQSQNHKVMQDAIRALIALGIKDNTAQKAAESAHQTLGDSADTSQVIALALKSV